VDILISLTNKIFLSIFCLEISWDVVKHPFCMLGRIGGCWLSEKWI